MWKNVSRFFGCPSFVEIYLGRTTSGTLFRGGYAFLGFAETGYAGIET